MIHLQTLGHSQTEFHKYLSKPLPGDKPINLLNGSPKPNKEQRSKDENEKIECEDEDADVAMEDRVKKPKGESSNELAVMSSQCCFLPIEKGEETTFNVALYN